MVPMKPVVNIDPPFSLHCELLEGVVCHDCDVRRTSLGDVNAVGSSDGYDGVWSASEGVWYKRRIFLLYTRNLIDNDEKYCN